mmetsp:Transcript_33970/g.86116  ORF Transcript_33970/g.86116 Transcript_33970/m.86116 type:complete len:346 (-) Transcript_33970:391-1428(-)
MATAGDNVCGSPAFEGNLVQEFQDSVPHGQDVQASTPESTDLTKGQPRKQACSRVALALIAGAFVIAAAIATAAVVGASLLNTAGSDSTHGGLRGHHGGCDEESGGDECYEHFGSNKDTCLEAGEGCQWVEDDGDGKCIEKRGHHRECDENSEGDECYEHFGSNKDQCLEAGENCQWFEDDGEGKCIEKRGHHGGKPPKKRCAKFGRQECSGTDGLCEWKADTNSTNGTCVPTFAYLNATEVEEAACELKPEPECTESSLCGWSGGTCRFSNFKDVCKGLFGTDADRCLQQKWLCTWAEMPDGEEAACTMKLPGGGGSGSQRRRRRRPGQGGHGGGGRRRGSRRR